MSNEIKAKSVSEAIGTILAKLCYKAADALGSEFSNRTNQWRSNNAVQLLEKANDKYDKYALTGNESAHPRLVHRIIDEGSWTEEEQVQDMWAGLLASACTDAGNDESNLIFVTILSQLTGMQAKIINHACKNAEKITSNAGWILADRLVINIGELKIITGNDDFHRLDRELDHLRSLELIGSALGGGGFSMESTDADITPTPLALQMYVRCQGFKGSPIEYYDVHKALG